MAESTTDVRVTDWPSSGNQSLSSSKPLRCCRRFPAVPDFRRPGKLSHKYKSTGGPLPSVCLTFCFSQSTWSLSYPHFPARCIPEPPSFLPGTEKAACPQPAAYRGTGPGRRAAVLLGPTGADLPSSTEVPGLHRGGFLPGKSQKVLRLRGGGGVCVSSCPSRGSGWRGDGGAEDYEHPKFGAGGHLLKIWNCCAEKTNKSRCSPMFCSIVSHGREDLKYQSDDCISGCVYCKGNYWRIFFFSCELGIVYTARKNPTVLFCGVIFLTFVLFQLF